MLLLENYKISHLKSKFQRKFKKPKNYKNKRSNM